MMTIDEFAEACIEYNKQNNITLDIKKPTECPVHIFAGQISKGCKAVNAGTKICIVCGMFMCPVCASHSVSILSRITGYLSTVSDNNGGSWNNAKLEEFKQRKRVTIS